jgi:hypothetical protein
MNCVRANEPRINCAQGAFELKPIIARKATLVKNLAFGVSYMRWLGAFFRELIP